MDFCPQSYLYRKVNSIAFKPGDSSQIALDRAIPYKFLWFKMPLFSLPPCGLSPYYKLQFHKAIKSVEEGTSNRMPEIGQTISHLRILEKIGVGGMGEVYLAEDLSLDRKVALKFLPDVFTGDPERMARFEREAKLLASLNCPNIAAIYGLEQAEGKRFLIMEYVEGETLQARISKGALPLEEALGVCRYRSDKLTSSAQIN
jgi:serine/threonine protein kinase